MKIDIIASTNPGYVVDKKDLDDFCGKVAGVCYMPHSFNELLKEDETKTEKRVNRTMNDKHHSVFEHGYITLYLENIPKLMAMVLNNEKVFVTSEKSARYTEMKVSEREQLLYNKWKDIILEKIKQKYPQDNQFFNNSRREKLAQENARYMISDMTHTSMVYTLSYRQLNYLCAMFEKEINKENSNYKILTPYFKEFVDFANKSGYIDERLKEDGKNRELSLFSNEKRKEYFGDVYCTNYMGTIAQYGQAQRHRTINYEINFLSPRDVYIPEILLGDYSLILDWVDDITSVGDLRPQGFMYDINERGTVENLIMKAKERLCSFAQLEIDQQTRATIDKYANYVKGDAEMYNKIKQYTKGSRCTFPDYRCPNPCAFKDGVTGERLI